MIRVISVELTNFCQYGKKSFELSSGLTAVIGPNRTGKSNFLRGLAYGLTGLVDFSFGSQQDLQKTDSAVPGHADVTFTDGSRTYLIRRFSTSDVKFPDIVYDVTDGKIVEVVIRRKSVDAWMSQKLGVQLSVFFQLFWARQGNLSFLLTATPTEVNAFLSMIFDMKAMEKKREVLAKKLNTIVQLSPLGASSAAEADAVLKTIPSDEELLEKVKAAEASLQSAIEEKKKFELLMAGAEDHNAYIATKQRLSNSIKLLEMELAELETVKAPKELPEDPKDVLVSFSATVKNEIKRLEASLQDTGNLVKLENELSRQKRDLESHMRKWTDMKARLATVEEQCPMCGSDLHGNENYRSGKIRTMTGCGSEEEYERMMLDGQQSLEQSVSYAEAKLKAEKTIRDGKKLEKQTKESEASSSDSLIELWNESEAFEKAAARKKTCLDQLSYLKSELLKHENVKIITDKDSEEFETLATNVSFFEQCKKEADNERANASANRILNAKIKDAGMDLARRYEINQEARMMLTDIRALFSSGRSQARYLANQIRKLNAGIAHYMKLTEMPFTLFLDGNDHVFRYLTSEGFVRATGSLSGAEKAMSSIVLQMAMFEVVNPDISLYLMDEPAESMDPGNKEVLSALLARLGSLLHACMGSVLIVTRDNELIDACENVLQAGN